MSLRDDWIATCKADLADQRTQLEQFESGTLRLSQRRLDGKWVDISSDRVEAIRQNIAELEAIVARHKTSR